MFMRRSAARTGTAARSRGPGRAARMLTFLGPGFVVAVAYVDPGNLATNVGAGATYGYALLWVILLANVMAMLIQYLSATLGLATGRNLAQHCRDTYSRPVRGFLWLQAEVMVIMTDLAEVVGGALALNLLFGLPLLTGATLTVAGMLVIFAISRNRRRRFEVSIIVLLAVILVAFVAQSARAGFDAPAAAGGLLPSLPDQGAALLAVGIIGATVMPHAIYLHSALTQDLPGRDDPDGGRAAARSTLVDVLIALSVAGTVNVAILIGATSLFGRSTESLTDAYTAFGQVLGQNTAIVFAIAMLASGLAASCVGVYSGQVVLQGFARRTIPIWLRRAVSLVPAFGILALGVDATTALVLSQVVLSFGIPFALIPLLRFTGDARLMGALVSGTGVRIAATAAAGCIVTLNVYLLVTAVPWPG